MLADFRSCYGSYIQPEGDLSPYVTFPLSEVVWAEDLDGLVMTAPMLSPNGDTCLVSILFAMPAGEVAFRIKRKRFPAYPGDLITVLRMVDEVTGSSGERYSRFLCSVTKTSDRFCRKEDCR